MKTLIAAAALIALAAPAQAFSVEGLVGAATVQVQNGAYDRACKTMTLAAREAVKQGFSRSLIESIEQRKDGACRLAERQSSTTGPAAVDPIKLRCMDEWGTDYRMVKYCVDQQRAAKASLGL